MSEEEFEARAKEILAEEMKAAQDRFVNRYVELFIKWKMGEFVDKLDKEGGAWYVKH